MQVTRQIRTVIFSHRSITVKFSKKRHHHDLICKKDCSQVSITKIFVGLDSAFPNFWGANHVVELDQVSADDRFAVRRRRHGVGLQHRVRHARRGRQGYQHDRRHPHRRGQRRLHPLPLRQMAVQPGPLRPAWLSRTSGGFAMRPRRLRSRLSGLQIGRAVRSGYPSHPADGGSCRPDPVGKLPFHPRSKATTRQQSRVTEPPRVFRQPVSREAAGSRRGPG